jgi:hypothetical protein
MDALQNVAEMLNIPEMMLVTQQAWPLERDQVKSYLTTAGFYFQTLDRVRQHFDR